MYLSSTVVPSALRFSWSTATLILQSQGAQAASGAARSMACGTRADPSIRGTSRHTADKINIFSVLLLSSSVLGPAHKGAYVQQCLSKLG